MQEGNAIETRNSGGLSGLITGLGGLIKTAAPVAADIYSLKTQGQMLKNQSANDLARLKAEQEALRQQATGLNPSVTAGGSLPSWFKPAVLAVGVLVLVLVLLRLRK